MKDTKRCPKCKIYKLRDSFYKNKATKDGLYGYCKSCHIGITKKWKKENKKLYSSIRKKRYYKRIKLFTDYKKELGLKCQECDENHPACLVFHHRNPSKKSFNIGCSIAVYSIERIIKEIAKCDVLCANCHARLHHALKGTI